MRKAHMLRATIFTLLLVLVAYVAYIKFGILSAIAAVMADYGLSTFWAEKAYWFVLVLAAGVWATVSGIYNDFKNA